MKRTHIDSRVKLILLAGLFLLAVLVRLTPGKGMIIFPYDQARDALIAKQIIEQRDLPLLGPVSDIPGVHHGAIYYWLITPLYVLNQYDPGIVLVVFVLLSSLGVFTYYLAGRRLFSEKVGWIAATLYAFSFLTIAYARWISNPPLVIPLMPIFIVLLHELVTKKRYALWLGLFLGLFVQLELVLGYLLFGVGFWVLKSAKIRQLLFLTGGFVIGSLPLFLAELKFGMQGLRGLLGYAASTSSQTIKTSGALMDLVDRYAVVARDSVFGLSAPLALFLFLGIIVLLIRAWKEYLPKHKASLLVLGSVWLTSLLLFGVGKSATNFFLVGQEFVLIVVFAFVLAHKVRRYFFLMIILSMVVLLQLRLFAQSVMSRHAYVQVQQGVMLSEREEVIRSMYEKTGDQLFTLSVFGTPYGVRTAWSYYLWLYQSKNNTPLPSWYGFAANGYIGDELLPHVDAPGKIHVTVFEPEFSVDTLTLADFIKYQEEHTRLVEEFQVNHHRIQIRRPL